MTTKCAGLNCTSTDGTNHSPECRAEHAAAVAGGRFVKLPRDNANPQDLIALLRTFIGDTQIVRVAREAADLIEQQAARIAEFERILDGLPQDAIDGGWTARGISAYAKQLESRLGAQAGELVGEVTRSTLEGDDQGVVGWYGDPLPIGAALYAALAASEPKNTGN